MPESFIPINHWNLFQSKTKLQNSFVFRVSRQNNSVRIT
jgi:hypothetical protein